MKFKTLFLKELKEMLNAQTIMIMLIMVGMLVMMGQSMNKAMEDSTEEMMDINLCVQDDTEFTNDVVKFLTQSMEKNGGKVNIIEVSSDDYAAELKRLDKKNMLIISEGFYDSVKNNEPAKVEYVQKITSLGSMSNVNVGSETALQYLEAAVKQVVYSTKVSGGKLTEQEVTFLNQPIDLQETTVVNNKSDSISASIVASLCSSQAMLVPMLMYILIMMASNMMINAMSTEKIDKTLETLLSAPVSRLSVILAKMLAAGVVAAMQAAVYMVGMNKMTSGMLENLSLGENSYDEVLKNLGLTLGTSQYVLVGIQMFLTILIVLSISLILGVLAKDSKSAQTLTLPILAVTVIPFIVTMLFDVDSLSPVLRYAVYAIPFTHSFSASQNVMFGKTGVFTFGLIYQFVFLCICLAVALRIFLSDRIFTMSIGGKKSKGVQPTE